MTATPTSSAPLLSLVIPCYQDEFVIPITHETIKKTLVGRPEFRLEVVYIDDGCSDGTLRVLREIAAQDDWVQVLSLSRNFGQQAATTAGLHAAKGDAVAIMDSDLQDPPETLIPMFARWREGYDVVYAVRRKRKESGLKRFGYNLFYRVMGRLADIEIPRDSGDFSIMGRVVVDALNALPEKRRFIRGLRAWTGFKQTAFEYERAARTAGVSHYSFRKIVGLAMDGLLNFSTLPLRVITYVGLATAMSSFALALLFLLQRIFKFEVFGYSPAEVPGVSAVLIVMLFMSGMQLIGLGVLGEYIGRVYNETKGRPTFLVSFQHDSKF